MVEYDIVTDLYKLEFVADGEVHLMTFEDVLSHGLENKPGHIRLASYTLLLVLLTQLAISRPCRGQPDNFPSAHFLQLFYLLDHDLEPLGIIRRLAAHLVIAGLGKLFG